MDRKKFDLKAREKPRTRRRKRKRKLYLLRNKIIWKRI